VLFRSSTAEDLGVANTSDQAYPSQKAAKAYVDQVVSQIATSGVPDATTLAAGKVQLAGDLGGTATNPTVPALANKENTANKSLNVLADGTDNTKYPSVKAVKDYVDQATLGTALAADLANKANIASPVFTGTPTAPTPTLGDNSTKLATTAYVDAQVSAGAADASSSTKGIVKLAGDLGGTATSPTVPGLTLKEDLSNKSNGALGTSTTLYPTQNAVKTYVDSQVASATIVDADATTKGKIQLTGDLGGTASSPTVPGLTTKANIASPTFTGTVTSPIYASAPQNLTDAATISWNPANGLNANVTLGGNRTLSFSATPASGSYGTLVVTQDGTGGRTLTLPSGTNKVLGSTATTTIALSTAANAKDILNFYYDGLTSTYYWNVGQGYGMAATAAIVDLASEVTGTLPVANGGTGATTAGAALTALGAQSSSNLSTDISGDAASLTKYPAVKSIKDYVDASVTSGAPDATTSLKGKVQLSGDLAGTAASPSVIKLRGTPISSVAPTTAGHVLTYDVSGSATWAAPANSANTISGVVPVANGGTGLSSVTSGGAVYASSSSALTTGTLPLTAGGTGATTANNAFNALSPMTTAGDIIYGGTNGAATRLGIGANATVLQVANGIPSWASISTGDLKFVYSNNNIGIGTSTTLANATQGDNVAIGRNALGSYYTGGISGSMNIGIGTDAGDYNSTGANNVYVGASSGITNQTGSYNTFMGYNTATSANRSVRNSISNSTAIGANAVVTTSNSIQLGDASVTNVATAGTITANTVTYPNTHGTANQVLTTTGSGTLTWSTPSSGVPYSGATGPVNLGAYNLTVSSFTIGQGKTPASGDNLAIGRSALNNTTTNGWPNIGLGSFSLNQTTDGKNNIGLGLNALYANTTGSANIGIGSEAARNAATSSNITAVGMEALKYESGAGNTALGSFAGKPGNSTVYAATTNSTFLGYNTSTGKTSDVTITNATAIGYGATVTASNLIQLGNSSVTNVSTSGTLTAGDITYPKTHGTANQVLTTTGSGTLTFTTPVVAKPISDQFTATAGQTVFTLTQTPITNTTTSPNVKPNVWMFINGVRTNNLAYTISGVTVTYSVASNNSYTIVVGDRVQFDYSY